MGSVPPTSVSLRTWCRLAVPCPPRRMRLAPGEVHVWRLDLNVPATQVSELNRTLDDDERARGARLAFDADRSHFISAHSFVRRLLGSYLGLTPEAVRYDRAPRGKPHIRVSPRDTNLPLRFNLSSSDDTALLAVSLNREVGVDIEKIRSERDCIGIAERFFSPRETATLRRLGSQERTPAFYRCWTRKEAYVKATGDGMFLPLNSFVVPVGPPDLPLASERPDPVFSSVGEAGQRRWKMIGVPEIAGFAAALVVESDEVNSAPVLKQRDPIVRFFLVRSDRRRELSEGIRQP
jgi:4'-phosphopantetheinyl transferase